jgi:HK97 family phage major capsid protein/HK97 family phage prohead protease
MNYLNLQVKAAAAGAKLYRAIAWSGNEPDRSGEQFDPRTFDLSAIERHPLPLLFGHDHQKIAGSITRAWLDNNNLMIEFSLASTDLGNQMATLIAEGSLSCVSVGFIAREAQNGVTSRELLEVSLVSVPMHQNAVITQRNFSGDTQMSVSLVRNKSEQQNYSVSRFLLGLSDPLAAKHAGFEFEVSRELARLSGKSSDAAMIPWSALSRKAAQETTTTASPDNGLSLAQPMTDSSMFMQTASSVFKQSVASRAGVKFYSAPATSEYKIPRMVSTVSTDFVARDTALAESNAQFDTVSAKPHTVGGMTRIMRSALIDARPDMESLILGELRKAISNSIDNAFLGQIVSTNANAPKGLLELLTGSATDVGAIADARALLEMIRAMQVNDDTGRLTLVSGAGFVQWATTSPVAAALNQTPLMSVEGQRIYGTECSVVTSAKLDVDSAGTISTTVPLILGQMEFAHMITFGSGIEVAVNPYAAEDWARGSILTRTIADIDFLVTDLSRFSTGSVSLA